MNLFAHFAEILRAGVGKLAAEAGLTADVDFSKMTVEPPREAAHGDISTNAAMVLAKQFGQSPRVLAEKIATGLMGAEDVAKAEAFDAVEWAKAFDRKKRRRTGNYEEEM